MPTYALMNERKRQRGLPVRMAVPDSEGMLAWPAQGRKMSQLGFQASPMAQTETGVSDIKKPIKS